MYLYKLNLIDGDFVVRSEFDFTDFSKMLCNTDRCLLDLIDVVVPTKVMVEASEIISIEFLGVKKISKDEWEEIKTKNNSYLKRF